MTDAANLLSGLEERWYTVRGCRVRAYCRPGVGPALLLVHGYGGAAWNFSELVPFLGDRPLIVPDLPGHGGSSPLPAPSIGAFADVLAAQVLETGLDAPVDVFGHSMGGVVALRLAERRPDLVRRLVLAATAGISSSTRLAEITITLIGIVQPARLAGWRADRIAGSRRLRRLIFGGYEVSNPDSLTERSVHGLLRGPTMHSDALGAGLALAADDPRLELDRVQCPVLVLWGARDRQVPLADAFEYARRLRAPLRMIADCGHLLISERPEVCARACASFLDTPVPGAPSHGEAVLG